MKNKEIRLVISGTYSVGKTTTTTALSIATGIPLIEALSAREILTDLYPGRRFQDMNSTELMALGLKRLEERIREEIILYSEGGNFISDGSVLNEYIYGTVRMKIGINPGAGLINRLVKDILGIPYKAFFKNYLNAYGQVTKLHAKKWYSDVIHLPIEFKMSNDGHRPVSEKYRNISNKELQNIFQEIGLSPIIVGGTQKRRLEKIIDIYDLPLLVPVDEAIKSAEKKIKLSRDNLSEKIISQYEEPSLKNKIKILSRY